MRITLALLLLPVFAAPAVARETPGDSTRVYSGRDGRLDVATPRLAEASITVDGRLDEPEWATAAVLTGFTRYEPLEGVPAEQRTEVLVFYSPSAVHIGIRAYDTQPDRVRATLAERDALADSDDFIRIALDTYDDARRAFVFYVNPLGVQQDGLWIEGFEPQRGFGPPIDFNPDFRWDSDGRLAEDGYRVEARIPLKSLRFPSADEQTWAINIARRVQRNGYLSTWAPVTRERSNQLAQAGRLQRLRGLDPGLFLEVNPVATARRTGGYGEDGGGFTRGDVDPDFGANVSYGLTSNLMLNATINPDFSQVEADAGQIAVNERFALFFPEKRPFFLEGTEIFQMPRSLVYTRRIADPRAAAKLTGKLGGTNAGYLGAVEAGGGGEAVYNVLRFKHDVGESTIGGVYTDRTVTGSDAFNRLAAADARILFGGRYTLQLLGAGARHRSDGTAGAENGTLFFASLARSGRNLSAEIGWDAVSPGFRTETGFIRRRDYARVQGRLEYLRFGESADLLEETGPELRFERIWGHDEFWDAGSAAEGLVQASWRFSFRGNLFFRIEATRRFFVFDVEDYDPIYLDAGPGPRPWMPDGLRFGELDGLGIVLFTNTFDWLRAFIRVERAGQPIFERSNDVAIDRARALSVRTNVTLRPTDALTVEVNAQHERIRRMDDALYSTATIPRLKAQYQFSRALFLRVIGEYAAVETEALRDPATGAPLLLCPTGEPCDVLGGDASNDAHLELLLAYEPTPGTVVYAGYTRDMTESSAFAFGPFEPRADGLFLKLSYLWRL